MFQTGRTKSNRHRLASLGAAWALIAIAGCGSSADLDRIPVSGKVTVDGQPLDSGTIQFFPHGETKGPMAGGKIENGFYRLTADAGPSLGSHLIRIAGRRKTGRTVQIPPDEYAPQGAAVDEMVDAVPSRYGEKSDLIRDITAPATEINFELESK